MTGEIGILKDFHRVSKAAAACVGVIFIASCASPIPTGSPQTSIRPVVPETTFTSTTATSTIGPTRDEAGASQYADLTFPESSLPPLPDLSGKSLWDVLALLQGTPAFVPQSLEELSAKSSVKTVARIRAIKSIYPPGTPDRVSGASIGWPTVEIELAERDGGTRSLLVAYPVRATPENLERTIPRELPEQEFVWFLEAAEDGKTLNCVSVSTCALTVENGQIVAPREPDAVGPVFPDTEGITSLDELAVRVGAN